MTPEVHAGDRAEGRTQKRRAPVVGGPELRPALVVLRKVTQPWRPLAQLSEAEHLLRR
jgi:hypothetical protein